MKKQMKMTVATEKTFKDGCEEYLLDCKARNLREGTLKHYTDVMKQLYKYIPEETPVAEMNADTSNAQTGKSKIIPVRIIGQ